MKNLTIQELDKLIISIAGRGKKLDADIQTAAVNCVLHSVKHNDASRINNLVNAMPKGARVNALRDFFAVTSPFDFDSEKGEFVYNKQAVKSFDEQAFIEQAEEKHWTEYKPEPKYVPFDAGAELVKLGKRAIADFLKAESTQTFKELESLLKLVGYEPTQAESGAIQAKIKPVAV